jgi:hypothetical protein
MSQQDSIPTLNIRTTDSTNTTDSLSLPRKPSSGIDSIVTYSAKDSVRFKLNDKMMRLKGNAKLIYRTQNLESEVIEMDFGKNTLKAEGVKDSSNKITGYPKFTEKGEVYFGETIKYNFKTREGAIKFGETEISNGYYFASKIKMKSEKDMYMQDGCFTTCDAPHPHYYFGSPKMEIIMQDKIFVDPIIFYVEELPLFALPFGLFLSNQQGRRSGIVIPSFFFSPTRGVTLENFGIYLALSDYYDTRFSADFFSKGGFTVKNFTQWKYQDILSGNLSLEFGRTRFRPDDQYVKNYKFVLNHNQSFSPQENLVASLNFYSQDFNRQTQWNQSLRTTQEITSNASYSKSFDNGSSFSVGYSRSQNIINASYSQTPGVSFSLPQFYPFKSVVSSDSWLKDIYLSYSGNASYQDRKSVTSIVNGNINNYDTTFANSFKVTHNPRLSFTLPKISYFTVTPYFNFGLNNYIRKGTKYLDLTDSTVKETTEFGFFTEYSYDAGVSISTRLYGMLKPKIFGINSIRHTLQPNISFSIRPDQSNPEHGFYSRFINPISKDTITYSNYERDGGGLASRNFSSSLNFSLINNISAKIAQGDTIEDKTIDVLSFNLGGYYDFAKKDRKLSDLSLAFHSNSLAGLNFSGSSNFTMYDEAHIWDTTSKKFNVVPLNDYLIENGRGLARMTSLNLTMSTGFSSSSGFASGGGSPSGEDSQPAKDNVGLGERFSNRINYQEEEFDFFGDSRPGSSKFVLPWTLSFNLNYSLSTPTRLSKHQSFTIGSNFTFNLTPTWFFSGFIQYDLITKQMMSPVINIRKDLHCWELNFTWYPVGYSRGFFLRFNIKSPMLKDLKWEQRESNYF